MKKIKFRYGKGLLLIFSILTIFACTEKLDIKPKQSIDAETALNSPENIKSTLVGAYLEARSTSLFGSYFNEYSELYAATVDLRFIGTYVSHRELATKLASTTNGNVEATWVNAYQLINKCNLLLQENVLAKLKNDDDKELIEGEAKFLRGWVLFEMVRLFGQPYKKGDANSQDGVPLLLTATNDVADAIKVARSSVGQCYTQLISDLTRAKAILPEENGVYATSFAASAVLARVYLQMGDFVNAATEANNVIQNGGFSLNSTPLEAFNNREVTTEDIFMLQNNAASNTSTLSVMYGSLNGVGRGDYDIQKVFLDQFDPLDLRGMFQGEPDMQSSYTITDVTKMYYFGVGGIANKKGRKTAKWGDYYANIPLIRLAEMYLIRAEANFESGTAQIGPNTPTQDINIVRTRALAPVYLVNVTRQQIRDERYFELCWEGHRLHDLKRWQLDIGTYTYDAGNLILPIPFREMEVNDLLIQNPWYLGL
ncbi:MAG: RagB/SusD family nutrient uptake outer membrane protein [Bacteroidales bacterium]|nr:MAG: RagB/SusD family nutrient uptake outer membrane protein [Bacteroidales bacterium]